MTRDILAWRRRDAAKPPPLLGFRSSYLFTLVTISVAVFTVRLSHVFFRLELSRGPFFRQRKAPLMSSASVRIFSCTAL